MLMETTRIWWNGNTAGWIIAHQHDAPVSWACEFESRYPGTTCEIGTSFFTENLLVCIACEGSSIRADRADNSLRSRTRKGSKCNIHNNPARASSDARRGKRAVWIETLSAHKAIISMYSPIMYYHARKGLLVRVALFSI